MSYLAQLLVTYHLLKEWMASTFGTAVTFPLVPGYQTGYTK